jgi:hypothetical protein
MAQQIRRLGLSKNIEVPVLVNTKTKFEFSDSILLLNKVLIHGIQVHLETERSPEFRQVLPFVNMQQTYLTLAGYRNEQYNTRFPLINFMDGNFPNLIFFKPKLVSIRKSFIEIPAIAGLVIPAGGYSIPFTIYYDMYDPKKHIVNKWGILQNDDNF